MGSGYLLDTNVCLYFLNRTLTPFGFSMVSNIIDHGGIAFSVITQIELLGFRFPSKAEQVATELFVNDALILALEEKVVARAILIRRQHKIKPMRRTVPDAIIAATALAHNLALVTRNTSDFARIEGLSVVDPFAGLDSADNS